MSSLGRWTYTNTAMVRAVTGHDKYGAPTYGAEYQIACTWSAEAKPARTAAGVEFVSTYVVYCEDKRPRYLDEIKLAGTENWQVIQSVLHWDMSPFGEADSPDFKITT